MGKTIRGLKRLLDHKHDGKFSADEIANAIIVDASKFSHYLLRVLEQNFMNLNGGKEPLLNHINSISEEKWTSDIFRIPK